VEYLQEPTSSERRCLHTRDKQCPQPVLNEHLIPIAQVKRISKTQKLKLKPHKPHIKGLIVLRFNVNEIRFVHQINNNWIRENDP
jgi:hypothetical protein